MIAAAVVVFIAAIMDLHSGKIPNILTGSAMVAGLSLGLLTDNAPAHLGGLAMGLIPGFLLWKNRGMGGGDAKLFAAVGALTSAFFVVELYFWSFAAGLIWVLANAVAERCLWATALSAAGMFLSPFAPGLRESWPLPAPLKQMKLRLAPFIAAGFVVVMGTLL